MASLLRLQPLAARMLATRTLAAASVPLYRQTALSFHSSPSRYSGLASGSQHKNSSFNNDSTPFEFTEANYDEIIAKYPAAYKQGATMPLLDLAQRQVGWLPLAAMNKVAKILDIPPMKVYEVATFYTMYLREPVGKHMIGVCTTTPCMLCDSQSIYETIRDHLGIDYGQTTKDGLFTMVELECLGACVNAPMISIGDDYYEDLTPESMLDILKAFQRGEKPKPGPYSGRKAAEPLGEKTSLFSEPKPPPMRTDVTF